MKKAVLEGNILPKAKQRFLVDGMPGADILYLTRDPVEISLGVIELPDQTKVPGGRRRAGEFGITLQFARDNDREAYLEWFRMAIDSGDESGINPNYKRSATIIYLRLFRGQGAQYQNLQGDTYSAGSNVPPVRARLYGVWCNRIQVPDYDMNGDEGDGDGILEATLQFDDVEIESNR